MIVISNALYLAVAEQEYPLCNPVIGYHNLVDVADITTDTEADGFPASNLANPSTNLKWRGTVDSPVADEYITIDVSDYVDEIDYVGIAGHNFGTAQIGCEIGYFDNDQSPPEWVQLVHEIMPADDGPLIFRYLPQSLSEIKIKLAPGNAAPEMAVVYVGKLLVMELGIKDFTPLRFGRRRDVITGMSEAGDFIGRIQVGGYSESSPSWVGLGKAWFRANVDEFLEAAATNPFFFAWNPLDYPFDTGFAWITEEPQPVFDVDGYVSLTLSMNGILR